MKINQITDINSKEFKNTMNIYINTFPINETRSVKETADMISNNSSYKLFIAQNNKKSSVLGFMLVYDFDNFILLDYMAVSKEYQDKGIGSIMFKWLIKTYKELSYDILLLEIERLIEPNIKTKQARCRFYERGGAQLITDSYSMPSYINMPVEVMLLFGVFFSKDISNLKIIKMIECIYKDVYNITNPNIINKLKQNLSII